jgi:arylsulfatase A-like enzyme/Tfp pilus assembly protein PilF
VLKVFFTVFVCACVLNLSPGVYPAARPNVLLISIDTLRADRLGCYGSKTKTPAIDSFAAESVLFENAISQVPLTLPSHTTIFTGLYPDQHGVRNNENFVLAKKLTTLAELFRLSGYATGAVVGSFSLDSSFGIDQGFVYYEDRIGQGHDPELNRHVERRAEAVWKLGKSWIDSQKGQWFAFLHFFDPHFPYNPPSGFAQTYEGEVGYTDRIIGSVLRHLRDTGRLDTTIVVLLSDHGESLGEHGEDNHGIFVYDSTVRVPLMIRMPQATARRVPQQVRLVDVAPTIAQIVGLSRKGFSGESLFPFFQGGSKELPAYSESYYANLLMGWAPLRAIRWKQQKWIDAPKPELYNLAQDPQETKNIYRTSAITPAFRAELRRHIVSQSPAESRVASDPETREKLASLGYIGGSSGTVVQSGYDPKDGIRLWTQIEEGVRDAQLKRWSASEQRLRAVLNKQPDNVIAQKFLANVLRKQERYDEAIALMQRALKSPLHRTETRLHLAETYADRKNYTAALEQALLVVQAEPRNEAALALAASLQSHLNHDHDALRSYSTLSRLRNLTEEEALRAAAIALTARNIPQGEIFFKQALQANGASPAAWKGLALIFASRRHWEDAADAFQKAGDCDSIKDLFQRLENPSQKMITIFKQCQS